MGKHATLHPRQNLQPSFCKFPPFLHENSLRLFGKVRRSQTPLNKHYLFMHHNQMVAKEMCGYKQIWIKRKLI